MIAQTGGPSPMIITNKKLIIFKKYPRKIPLNRLTWKKSLIRWECRMVLVLMKSSISSLISGQKKCRILKYHIREINTVVLTRRKEKCHPFRCSGWNSWQNNGPLCRQLADTLMKEVLGQFPLCLEIGKKINQQSINNNKVKNWLRTGLGAKMDWSVLTKGLVKTMK